MIPFRPCKDKPIDSNTKLWLDSDDVAIDPSVSEFLQSTKIIRCNGEVTINVNTSHDKLLCVDNKFGRMRQIDQSEVFFEYEPYVRNIACRTSCKI